MTGRLEEQFVGRSEELAELQGAIDSVGSGRGHLVLIGGEPGIGKSSLAKQACDLASSNAMRVVRGFASERAGAPPYWIWSQPLGRIAHRSDSAVSGNDEGIPEPLSLLVGSASGIVATDASVASVSSRYVLFEQVLRLLEQHTAQVPVVIFLDDLQWADESSLALLEFIAFDITGVPLLVIGTYRNVDLQPGHPLLDLLGVVGGKSGVTNLVLRGLGQSETGALVSGIAEKSIGQEHIGDLLTRTGGNPLFLKLLALAGESASGDVPQSVVDVIEKRVHRSHLLHKKLFELRQQLEITSSLSR